MTLDSIKSDSASNGGSGSGTTTTTIEPGPKINSKTTTSSDPDPDLICPVCNRSSISSCRNCKKISYCGKGHQRLHWKQHKSECFPLIHQYDPILGSRLIATRNIKAGEIIWKEKPILSGPGLILQEAENAEKAVESHTQPHPKLCLGCCRVINTDYHCPSCSWSMCGPNCGGKGDHEKLECKIFTREQLFEGKFDLREEEIRVGESQTEQGHGFKYGAITILRGVLFKDLDPPRWSRILELDDMWNGVECDNFVKPPTTTTTSDFGQFCHEFIMSLNLFGVMNEDVALVLSVISHRRFELYEGEPCNLLQLSQHTNPCAFHLFFTACQATQNCIPNSSWIIQQNPVEIHIRALLPIQFGRTVTLSYANVEEDIMGRQTGVGGYGESTTTTTTTTSVSCKCSRCQEEPGESGTFFSALKCPGTHGNSSESVTTNWLLPTLTTNTTTSRLFEEDGTKVKTLMWSCHECGLTLEPEVYVKVVAEIKKEFCDILSVPVSSTTLEENGVGHGLSRSKLIENLETLIQKHSPSSVHPNHVTMFKMEMILLHQLSMELGEADLTDEKWARMVERFTNLCKKWLEVGDVLWPGLSRQRGQLLYFYQQALTIQLIFSISRRMRGESREGEDPDDEIISTGVEEEEKEKKIEIKDLRQLQQSLLEKQFLKILSIRKVVVDIFCYDDVDLVGRKYADSLTKKCPEIELLKLYVFQNSCNAKFS